MSKGGAGKVYFVLYLAVILELLIIFIERDEAEEHLRRQQREAIQIVQTILSQLQTGQGTTGITAKPKDNITLSDKEPEANVRVYDVVVSVGDSAATSTGSGGERTKGDDIAELEYLVSHNPNPDIPEAELPLDTADLADPYFKAVLGTKHGGYFDPRQTLGADIPTGDPSAYFRLNEEATAQEIAKGMRVKVFRVNFKPNRSAGWYRLRFDSKTNKIMGVTGGKPSANDTVRIGNVKLTVKQLQSVQKFLAKEKDPNNETVMNYIEALLDPTKWPTLPGNQAWTSIDVRVVKPDLPPPADPVAEILVPADTIFWYAGAPFSVPVKLGPKEGNLHIEGATRVALNAEMGDYAAQIDNPVAGPSMLIARASNGGKTESSEKTLVVLEPAVEDPRRVRAKRATVGVAYEPATDWAARQIPNNQYQTVVEFNGTEVFNRAGTKFDRASLPDELLVTESTKKIEVDVFWKPGGTQDREKWIRMLTSRSDAEAPVNIGAVTIGYKPPFIEAGGPYTWVLGANNLDEEFGPIRITQQIGKNPSDVVGASGTPTVDCPECAEYGLANPRLTQVDAMEWMLFVAIGDKNVLKTKAKQLNGKTFDVNINAPGRGGISAPGIVSFTVRIGQ